MYYLHNPISVLRSICTCFNTNLHIGTCIYTYMRISTNHNSLGCEQPSRPRCRTITQCAICMISKCTMKISLLDYCSVTWVCMVGIIYTHVYTCMHSSDILTSAELVISVNALEISYIYIGSGEFQMLNFCLLCVCTHTPSLPIPSHAMLSSSHWWESSADHWQGSRVQQSANEECGGCSYRPHGLW